MFKVSFMNTFFFTCVFLLLLASSAFAKMETERMSPNLTGVRAPLTATKYSIDELAIFKAFTNTTKVKDFLIGDNGEGGGTKDFQVEREINDLLQVLPEKLDQNGKGEIEISQSLAKARKNQISLFSITKYKVRRNYLFKEVDYIRLDEIEYFYLSDLKSDEEIFTFAHLEGFKTKNGKVFYSKFISKLTLQVTAD